MMALLVGFITVGLAAVLAAAILAHINGEYPTHE